MAAFNYKQEYQRYKKYYLNLVPLLQQPVSRAYTTIIFSFLAISLFGWYAIRPTMQTIFELKREIADKTDLNQKMEEKISALIEAQAVYQDIETKIPVVTKSGVQGLAQGEFGNQLVLTKVAQNKKITEGEFVFTSGESGLPRGMVVGRLGKVDYDPAQLFQKGQITLLLEPSLLEIMFISVEDR